MYITTTGESLSLLIAILSLSHPLTRDLSAVIHRRHYKPFQLTKITFKLL